MRGAGSVLHGPRSGEYCSIRATPGLVPKESGRGLVFGENMSWLR